MSSPKQSIFSFVILALEIAVGAFAEARYEESIVHQRSSNCIRAQPEFLGRTYDASWIYRGEHTTIDQYPFMVSIQIQNKFHCGGVLYSKDLVLTSCSCIQLLYDNRFFYQHNPILSVRVASNYSTAGGNIIEASEVFFHPSYNPKTLVYNLAVIRLRQPAIQSDMIPRCIEVTRSANTLPSNVDVIILGWGDSTKSKHDLQNDTIDDDSLKLKLMPVCSNFYCEEFYGQEFVTRSTFCASTITTGEGACNHDDGGPAILDGQLVGIISSGDPVCGTPYYPAVFTHIGFFADWLDRISITSPISYKTKVVEKSLIGNATSASNITNESRIETNITDRAMTTTNMTDEALTRPTKTDDAMTGANINDKAMIELTITDEPEKNINSTKDAKAEGETSDESYEQY